jgi:DNA-directed RNA polymerase subunit L
MNLSDYSLETVKETPHRVYFNLNNAFVSLGNSIRRSMMSIIPTATFDDTWHEDISARSIHIKTNSSALHNEWFAHRLSLIPLNMTLTNHLKVKTQWKEDHRTYEFENPDAVPIFSLKMKNDITSTTRRNKEGHIEIYTDDIKVDNIDIPIDQFIPHDLFTDEPIVLNLLKYNPLKEEEGEEIDVILKPIIGLGKHNSRNDPTSTTTYSFSLDDDSKIERNFRDFLEYQNKERIEKGLSEYTDEEVIKIRNSFDRLDKYRVFKRQSDGQPMQIQFSVESNGFLLPHQIVFDGLTMLQLLVKDLLNCIHLELKDETLTLTTNTEKMEIRESVSERMGYDFLINEENHTIGNLIADYMRRYFVNSEDFGLESNLLKMASYTMPHPLQEKIIISSVCDDVENIPDIVLKTYSKILKVSTDTLTPIFSKLSINDIHQYLIIACFIKSCNIILSDLNTLKTQWTSMSGIRENSFVIADFDNADYMEHLILTSKLSISDEESDINPRL